MKTLLVSLFAFTSVTFTHAEWTFIKVLRTEPDPPPQRVAFVGSGTVKQVEGKVERLCGIDCWSTVKPGTELKAGDLIRTGNGSLVFKMDENQSFVRVTPNTVARLLPAPEASADHALADTDSGFVVRSCRGPAFYRDAVTDWKSVTVNSVLPASAIVRTEPGTTIDLFCGTTHHAIRLQGKKEVSLSSLATPPPAGTSLAAALR